MSLSEQVAELERDLVRTKEALKKAEDERNASKEEADDLRSDLRSAELDLAKAERELANRANELPAGLARIIKPWLTKTAVASRAELIDALPREHEALAQFLRAIQ